MRAGTARPTCAAMRTNFAFVCSLAIFSIAASAAEPSKKTVYVQFIRGTDKECQTPCREIGPKLSEKLSPVFRWKHYWEIDRRKITLVDGKATRLDMPGDRKLEIQAENSEVEARLHRKSGVVTKERKSLNKGMLIVGGEEASRESFFVVIRKDEPTAHE